MTTPETKLLYVIDGTHFGGGERVFLQLVSRLKRSFRIFVAASPGGNFQNKIEDENVAFIPLDLNRRVTPKPVFQISRAIKKYRIDIVHSQGARADFYTRVSGKLTGVAHQVCTLAMPVEGFDIGALRKTIYRVADKATGVTVDRFIVVSDALRKMLIEERGIERHRVVRIYNGIELDQYVPGETGVGLDDTVSVAPDEVLIGCFGRLVWQKGIEYLIRAIPAVASKIKSVRFLIVGDGPERARLEKLAEELDVGSRLTFVGFVDDIRPWLSRVNVVAIPSLQEGFPMVTLEAMAMAKPIVASNITGIDEQLCHNRSALLVPLRSPSALSEAIVKILQNRQLAEQLGSEAHRTVAEQFSVESMINATRRLYDALVQDGVADQRN